MARTTQKHAWAHRLIFVHAKNHVIPHKGNGHVPHLLHHHKLFGFGLLFVFLKAAVIGSSVALPAGSLYSSAISAANIISLTNATRAASGLSELVQNEQLTAAAQLKADNMLEEQYFAHTSPAGLTPLTWINRVGYEYQVAGENLAVHFSEAEDVQEGWMASSSHRANILDGRFEDIGVGVARGEYQDFYTTFVVQMFGTPREQSIGGELVNNEPAVSTPDQPRVDAETVRITPEPEGYGVAVVIDDADSASVTSGSGSAPLTEVSPNFWTGTVPYSQPGQGQDLVLVASRNFGTEVIQPIMHVAPEAEVKGFFHFVEESKKGGMTALISSDSIDDLVTRLYFFLMVVLGFTLLLSVAIKFEVQRHSILAHGLLVLILGGMLAVM